VKFEYKLVAQLLAHGGSCSISSLRISGVANSEIRAARRRRLVDSPHRGVVSLVAAKHDHASILRRHLQRAPRAVAVRQSAGALWGITSAPAEPAFDFRTRSDTARHASRRLNDWELTHRDGIVVTCIERTLIDMAWDVSRATLERLVERAINMGLCTAQTIASHLARLTTRGRKGVRNLRSVLASRVDVRKSDTETRFAQICRRHPIPQPIFQFPIDLDSGERVYLDAYWVDLKLAVELDGFAFHSAPREFRIDRRRQNAIQAAGIEVLRFTWHDVARDELYVAETLLARIASRRERAHLRLVR